MSILGIDVGGVIISREGDGGDTSFFSDNFLATPASKNAFEVISRVVSRFENVVIISKCGNRVQQRTKEWMAHTGFHKTTGIPWDKFYFCRERKDKVGIALDLGVTHFIDDRTDILSSMIGKIPFLFLFGQSNLYKGFDTLSSWDKLEQKLDRLDKWSKS
jgi:hypothetical protein